jgi:hypothetical protein
MASRVVELCPKKLPLLSLVKERREGGQERRAENQRSEMVCPPRLATPRGGRVRCWAAGKTPAAASDQNEREDSGGPRGGG